MKITNSREKKLKKTRLIRQDYFLNAYVILYKLNNKNKKPVKNNEGHSWIKSAQS